MTLKYGIALILLASTTAFAKSVMAPAIANGSFQPLRKPAVANGNLDLLFSGQSIGIQHSALSGGTADSEKIAAPTYVDPIVPAAPAAPTPPPAIPLVGIPAAPTLAAPSPALFAPSWIPEAARYTGVSPADYSSSQTEAQLNQPCLKCLAQQRLEHIPLPRPRPHIAQHVAAMQPPAPRTSNQLSCGQLKLLRGAMSYVRQRYGNRSYSGGNCGAGVGGSILRAGFPFATGGRYAINYMKFLSSSGYKDRDGEGWTRLEGYTAETAPPGSVLVYSGPCTRGYPQASLPRHGRCHSAGDYVGHVTIKGDPRLERDGRQVYYTDGRTKVPSPVRPPRRRLVGVFLPPGSDKFGNCGR